MLRHTLLCRRIGPLRYHFSIGFGNRKFLSMRFDILPFFWQRFCTVLVRWAFNLAGWSGKPAVAFSCQHGFKFIIDHSHCHDNI
jgi:hypothetical protein